MTTRLLLALAAALALPLGLWLAVMAHDAVRHARRRRGRPALRVVRGRG